VLTSTVAIAFQLAAKATRDAFFLSNFGVAALPLMVGAGAVASLGATLAFTRLLRRFGPGVLVPRLFAASGILLAGEWLLASASHRLAAIVVYLHITAFGALVVSGFWAMVTERFDPRAAKRVVAWITAAASAGGLFGGLIAERMGAVFPTVAMLPLLSLLHLAAAVLVLPLAGMGGLQAPGEHSQAPVELPHRVFARSPYLRELALLVALTGAAEGLLDYVFKFRATGANAQGGSLLRLFAVLYTGTSLLSILVQVTVLRPTLKRIGVARTAALLPGGVSLGAVGLLVVPGLGSVFLARGLEMVLRNSFFRSAQELLYSPVSPSDRRATKPLIDVGAARAGDIIGAGLVQVVLLGTSHVVASLLVGILALSLVALDVARRLNAGYVRALAGRLRDREEDLPAPGETAVAALLQTVGAMDLSALRSIPPPPPVAEGAVDRSRAPDRSTPLERLASSDLGLVRAELAAGLTQRAMVQAAIPLLAWDAVASDVVAALRAVAPEFTGLLIGPLEDPDEDFAVRRRLVGVLAYRPTRESLDALLVALNDSRFEVRYRAGRALARLAEEMALSPGDRGAVLLAVEREVAVERGVWEGRRLIDADDDFWSPSEADVLRTRANRSLEHVFTLLSLVLPGQQLPLAFRALHTDDRHLRGTALEYLENVLPEKVRDRLWPFLEDKGTPESRSRRPTDTLLQDLLGSRESIVLALEEVRRRSGGAQRAD
jgi:ATP:ADP antiporter, AAA family